jgi:hypothetical protein
MIFNDDERAVKGERFCIGEPLSSVLGKKKAPETFRRREAREMRSGESLPT